jgi:hypothetical protein
VTGVHLQERHAAAKVPLHGEVAEWPEPFRLVPRQQLILAAEQSSLTGIAGGYHGVEAAAAEEVGIQPALDAEQFGATDVGRVAILLQPVGQDQPAGDIAGVLAGVLEQRK